MKWIIQDNLFREEAIATLIEILKKADMPYELVKVIPFTDGHLTPDPDIEDGENAIVIGSGTLNKYAKRKKLIPGAWTNENFNYQSGLDNYGDRMLNSEARFVRLEEARHYMLPDEEYFLRPNDDGKSFAGTIMRGDETIEWFKKVTMYEGVDLTKDTLVMVCPLKKIYNENRMIAVKGKIITGSVYKVGDRVSYSKNVDDEVYAYAQECIDIWQPGEVFTIDIASTPDGLKVIEINNFNSAGWYHCDVAKIVEVIINEYAIKEKLK